MLIANVVRFAATTLGSTSVITTFDTFASSEGTDSVHALFAARAASAIVGAAAAIFIHPGITLIVATERLVDALALFAGIRLTALAADAATPIVAALETIT